MVRVEADKEIWMSGVVRVVKRRWRALAKQARGWMGGRTVSDTDDCLLIVNERKELCGWTKTD